MAEFNSNPYQTNSNPYQTNSNPYQTNSKQLILQPIINPPAQQLKNIDNNRAKMYEESVKGIKREEIIIQQIHQPMPQPYNTLNMPLQHPQPNVIIIQKNKAVQPNQINQKPRRRVPQRMSQPVQYYRGDTYIYPYYYDSSGCYYCCWFNGNCCPCQTLHQNSCSYMICDPFPCCNGCTGFHCGCLQCLPPCNGMDCVQNNNIQCCNILPCCSGCQFCSTACDGACISALPCCNGCQFGDLCQVIPCCNGCEFEHIFGCLPCCNGQICNICECLQGCQICNCADGCNLCGNGFECLGNCDCGNCDCNGCDGCDLGGCDCDLGGLDCGNCDC